MAPNAFSFETPPLYSVSKHGMQRTTLRSPGTNSGCSIDFFHSGECSLVAEDNELGFTKAMAKVIRGNDGVIGQGDTSVVIGGTFEGRLVAVKTWNGVSNVGLDCLLNEIQIYRAIHQKQSEALGVAVPNLHMGKMFSAEDATLVVDRVGKGVCRRRDGSLILQETRLEKHLNFDDIQKIYQAAIRSLCVLHCSNVLHGDIALRSVRVQEETRGGAKLGWRAWCHHWIDLGMAKIGNTSVMEFEIELEQFASLLPEAESNLAISVE